MYTELFTELFRLVEYLTGDNMLFQPIHHAGLQAIVMDIDSKQYRGKLKLW